MRKRAVVDPLVHCSVAEVMRIYIEEQLITRPALFGLPDFSARTLLDNAFDMVGDADFCLYEKYHRIAGSTVGINFKVYYNDGILDSNGVDFSPGARLNTVLEDLRPLLKPDAVRSIELVVFADLLAGSLLLNDALVIRFGVNGKRSQRDKYHVTGISTDAAFNPALTQQAFSTRFARSYNDEAVPAGACGKYQRNPALRELLDYLSENFGEAFQTHPA